MPWTSDFPSELPPTFNGGPEWWGHSSTTAVPHANLGGHRDFHPHHHASSSFSTASTPSQSATTHSTITTPVSVDPASVVYVPHLTDPTSVYPAFVNYGGAAVNPTAVAGPVVSAIPPVPPVPPPEPTHVVPPPSSSSMEDFAAKQLLRDMQSFSGGVHATTQWPSFWTCMKAVMAFPQYSPLDGLLPHGELVTTPLNRTNSRLLYTFLLGKLRDAALDAVHATNFADCGFELLDHLRQTYAPQRQSDTYANFLGLIGLEMAPNDTLEKTVQRIQQFASALEAGGAPLPSKFLSMVFMNSLDDRYELLKQSFVLDSEKYSTMSLHQLYTTTLNFTTSSKQLLSSSATPFAASAASSPGSPTSATMESPPTLKPLNGEDIKLLVKSGTCLCHRKGHAPDKCLSILHAGYLVTHDIDAARKALADRKVGKDNPPGKDDPSSPCVGVAGAVSAQSSEPHTSSPYYAPLDSDDENDAFQQDMGVV
jgi:hypothetical protein